MILGTALIGCSRQTPAAASAPDQWAEPSDTAVAYSILSGTEQETEITVLTGEKDGPVVFVIAGIHGDETAGWKAAEALTDEAGLSAGTLYILPAANRTGVEDGTRTLRAGGDLNRAFPGKPEGTLCERLAYAVYSEIADVQPDIVLDLHEAQRLPSENGAGNTLIFSNFSLFDKLLFDIKAENEAGEVGQAQYTLLSPGVEGSINRTVTELLEIPVLTIETWQEDPLDRRVADQLEIIHYILRYMGLE